ncbi:MAG: hypothetical protein ACFFB0_08610 [Promethearchaeota archaeon]
MVKIFCYFILIVAFVLFYQRNPVFGVILIILFLVVFIVFKLRKHGVGSNALGYFSNNSARINSQSREILTLLMLQSLFNDINSAKVSEKEDKSVSPHEKEINKLKEEILELLDGK